MTAAQDEMMKKARESLSASGHLATGGYYDFAVNARIEGDYEPGGKFTEQDAALRIAHADEFIAVAEEKLGPLPSTANEADSDKS